MFIDKTEFIAEFMDSNYEVNVILRPRRFGKSTNLGMLQTFFSHNTPQSYRAFFERSLLGKNQAFIHQYFRRFPVLFLDLKDCGGNTWNEMYHWVWVSLLKMISPHAHILREYLDPRYLTSPYDHIPPSDKIALSFLARIMESLCAHYNGTQVIVLVDEFDTPLNTAFQNGYSEAATKFFGHMFSMAFKGNPAMLKVCMVGILEPVGSGILSKLNNVGVFSVAQDCFSRYFGFTHEEIFEFLNRNASLTAQVFSWYDGYHIGPHLMINPWSFLSWVSQRNFAPYWVETSCFESVATVLQPHLRQVLVQTLMLLDKGAMGRVAVAPLISNVEYASPALNSANAVLHFLVLTGYLTYEQREDSSNGFVFIPNKEVRLHWERSIVDMIRSHVMTTPGLGADLSKALEGVPFNLPCLHTVMRTMLVEFCSNLDTEVENSYHCFYFGCFAMAIDDGINVIVASSAEGGSGQFDIRVKFRPLGRLIVIKFKKSDTIENLLEDAKMGLKEIMAKEYTVKFDKQYECILIGVSFCSKQMSPLVCTRMKRLDLSEVCHRQNVPEYELEICPAQEMFSGNAALPTNAAAPKTANLGSAHRMANRPRHRHKISFGVRKIRKKRK